MHKKIAFVKTGWSDTYQGGAVFGRHDYISKYKDAHERFNFLPGPDGQYFGYIPPIGTKYSTPQPENPKDWLVIFVAADRGKGPLTIVGWYESANFEDECKPRPEYDLGIKFETDVDGEEYLYCITSEKAILIPAAQRTIQISGKHFRRSPIIYVRGTMYMNKWRTDMATLAEKFVRISSPNLEESGLPMVGFPDAEHRKKVEKSSIAAVKKYLKNKGYNIQDRQKDYCGYDLLSTRKRKPKELHVEVKGTSTSIMQFFITKNERNYMQNPKWRLAIVINALNKPKIHFFDNTKTNALFEFSPLAWVAKKK